MAKYNIRRGKITHFIIYNFNNNHIYREAMETKVLAMGFGMDIQMT